MEKQVVSISFLPLMVDLGRLGIEFEDFEALDNDSRNVLLDEHLGNLKVDKIELITKTK